MTLFAPSCSSTEGEPDPTVKRTPDVPDDRSLCFALKLYRQRHDLPRAGGTVRNSPRSSGILPSVAPGVPPGPAVPTSTRERDTGAAVV
jgi:hypothetical protein